MASDAIENAVSALLLGQFDNERSLVNRVFGAAGWQFHEARNRRQALERLRKTSLQVVICESELAGWNWKDVLDELRRIPCPPQLVVASRVADDRLWAEALNIGAFDVLAQPFEAEELRRVIESAARHFSRQPVGSIEPLGRSFSAA